MLKLLKFNLFTMSEEQEGQKIKNSALVKGFDSVIGAGFGCIFLFLLFMLFMIVFVI